MKIDIDFVIINIVLVFSYHHCCRRHHHHYYYYQRKNLQTPECRKNPLSIKINF